MIRRPPRSTLFPTRRSSDLDWFARRGWTRAYNWSWGYFAVVNAAPLGVGVFSYGKKDRVAPLVYLEHRHEDRKSTRLNSSHSQISYAVFCLKKKKRASVNVRSAPACTPASVQPGGAS